MALQFSYSTPAVSTAGFFYFIGDDQFKKSELLIRASTARTKQNHFEWYH
jgi:hypothetical protein